MLTVGDVQAVRLERARTNHETYKLVLQRVYDRIRHRSSLNATDLAYAIPPFVPGRPVYDQSHAARYVTEKLQRGGFRVATDDAGALVVDWSLHSTRGAARTVNAAARTVNAAAARPPAAEKPEKTSAASAVSKRLEALKTRLKL
jgi:hypothetical protein